MERELVRLLPYLLGGMFIMGVLLFLLSLHQLRVRRTGSYWLLRRRAGERGGRLFLLSVGLIVASVALTVITGLAAVALRDVRGLLLRRPDDLYGIVLPSETALTATREAVNQALTATEARRIELATAEGGRTPEAIPSETATPAPSMMPTATAVPDSPTPPATATVVPSATPSATPNPALNLTPQFNVTPRPAGANARITITTADDTVNPNGSPFSPQDEFPVGTTRVYLFLRFEDMENGVAWSRVLYRDGVPLQGNTLLWSLGAAGSSYFFFGSEAGYDAGDYEVRLFIGEREASRFSFTIRG